MSEKITVERDGRLLLIGLNRPDGRNRIDSEMVRGLVAAYTELSTDAGLWCGVLFAHGDDFCFGLDLPAVAPELIQGGPEAFVGEGQVDPWGLVGERCAKPVVAAVHGRCLTAGLELALAGDLVVAAEGTTFGQMEVSRGVLPLGGATVRMVEVFGWHGAMRYLLTGEMFDVAEGRRIGLVTDVAVAGEQKARAIELAERIAANAPLAVQATLANARLGQAKGKDAAVAELLPTLTRLFSTQDAQEGIMSLMEKRLAKFTGA
jgi:enoyl-CoA hydratase/carnithine racemase